MNSSTRMLALAVAVFAILWPSGDSCASFMDLVADETGTVLPLPTNYLIEDSGARILGPFDPFWSSDRSADQRRKLSRKRPHQTWKPVRLVMSQWTEIHEEGCVAEPRSDAGPASSGGGGGGGYRNGYSEQTSFSPIPTTSQWLPYAHATSIPATSNSETDKRVDVATPLPPSVLLFGSGLAGLLAMKRRCCFRRTC